MSRKADELLLELVSQVGIDFPGFGITLTIGGVFVSGTLITKEHYFSLINEKEVPQTDSHSGVRTLIQKVLDYSPDHSSDYIHLKDVYFMSGSGMGFPKHEDSITWRGKISSVDGFHFGKHSPIL